MRHTALQTFAIATLALTISLPASATVIWSDSFDRANSDTPGNAWDELERDSNDVAIYDNYLRLRDQLQVAPDAQVAQSAISTSGYNNVRVQFSWAALTASENSDYLKASWRINGTASWIELMAATGLELGGDGSFQTAAYALGPLAGNTTIDFRFWTDVSDDVEGARIDWVQLTGDSIIAGAPTFTPASALPEPASLILLSAGLLGMGMVNFRKQSGTA